MHGDLTRSKSNKGSVDGQFSHEFLHRTVWRGRLVGFCAGWPFPVQPYQAAERLFLHTRTSMVRSCATTTAGPSRRMPQKAVQQSPSNSLYLSLGERPKLPFTARINDPSKLARCSSHGMAPVLVPLRPSSEHILIVRAPGARDRHRCHSTSFIVRVLRAKKAPDRSLLILLRPRVARAQKIIRLHPFLCSASKEGTWPFPPHPSEVARCASIEDDFEVDETEPCRSAMSSQRPRPHSGVCSRNAHE